MATLWSEPGSAATQDLKFFYDIGFGGTGAAITSDAQAVAGSVRSVKCNAGSTGSGNAFFRNNSIADAGQRISCFVRWNQAPGLSNIISINDDLNAGATMLVAVTAAFKLAIYDSALTLIATGTTVLSANTDYRISLRCQATNDTTNSFVVYLNGVSEVTATNITLFTPTTVHLQFVAFGFFSTGVASPVANSIVYVAHEFIDNITTGEPGNVKVTAKRPNANGTTNGFTTQIGVGGSGYGGGHSPQVNERALSNVNGWAMVGAGSAVTEEYAIEGKAVGDIDISGATIIDYMGWVDAKALASETGSIIVGGATSNISLTSTETLFTQMKGSATYPAGATDIGIITTTALTTVSLYECGIVVVYIPATAATYPNVIYENPRAYSRDPALRTQVYFPDASTATLQARLQSGWVEPNPRAYQRPADSRAWSYFPDASTATIQALLQSGWIEPNPRTYVRGTSFIYFPDASTTTIQVPPLFEWTEPNPRTYVRGTSFIYFPDASTTTVQAQLQAGWVEPNPRSYPRPADARYWTYYPDASSTAIQALMQNSWVTPNPRLYVRPLSSREWVYFYVDQSIFPGIMISAAMSAKPQSRGVEDMPFYGAKPIPLNADDLPFYGAKPPPLKPL